MESLENILKTKRSREKVVNQDFEQLIQGLKEGRETTGDKLDDGLLIVYGTNLEQLPSGIEAYKQLASKLEGKSGDLVVVLKSDSNLAPGCYGFGAQARYNSKFSYEMGVLAEDEITLDDTKANLGFGLGSNRAHHMIGHGRQMDKTFVTEDTRIELTINTNALNSHADIDGMVFTDYLRHNTDPYQWPFNLHFAIERREPDPSRVAVLIGQEEIADWLDKKDYDGSRYQVLKGMAQKLGANFPKPSSGLAERLQASRTRS